MEGKLVYDDFSEEFLNWLSEEEPEPDYGSEVKKATEEMTEFYNDLMKTYEEDEENSLPYLLAEDDVLQEELVDRLTFVNLIEEAQDTDFCAAEKCISGLARQLLRAGKDCSPDGGVWCGSAEYVPWDLTMSVS